MKAFIFAIVLGVSFAYVAKADTSHNETVFFLNR